MIKVWVRFVDTSSYFNSPISVIIYRDNGEYSFRAEYNSITKSSLNRILCYCSTNGYIVQTTNVLSDVYISWNIHKEGNYNRWRKIGFEV